MMTGCAVDPLALASPVPSWAAHYEPHATSRPRSSPNMFSTRTTRLLTTALCSGSVAAAMLAGATPALADQDPGANPPNCSAADLEGVRAGVSAATSAYLFTHPDVNDFFTNLEALPRD